MPPPPLTRVSAAGGGAQAWHASSPCRPASHTLSRSRYTPRIVIRPNIGFTLLEVFSAYPIDHALWCVGPPTTAMVNQEGATRPAKDGCTSAQLSMLPGDGGPDVGAF